jgi:undecaprenyl pyrophosphate phosphatase UppP
VGIAASFVVGLGAIHFLLGYVRQRNLDAFVWYRVGVAVLVFFIAILRFR